MTFDQTSCCLKMYNFLSPKEELRSHGELLCKCTTKKVLWLSGWLVSKIYLLLPIFISRSVYGFNLTVKMWKSTNSLFISFHEFVCI